MFIFIWLLYNETTSSFALQLFLYYFRLHCAFTLWYVPYGERMVRSRPSCCRGQYHILQLEMYA